MKMILALIIVLISPLSAMAEVNNGPDPEGFVPYEEVQGATSSEADQVSPAEITRLRIDNEFWYIILLGVLCIVSLIIVLTYLHLRNHSAKDVVNASGLTLIIFGTIILVLVVSTSEQLTAAIGILGAIAGYLFRSVQNHETESGKG